MDVMTLPVLFAAFPFKFSATAVFAGFCLGGFLGLLWYDIGWLVVLLLKLCLGCCLYGLNWSLGTGIRWVLLLLGDRPLIVQ